MTLVPAEVFQPADLPEERERWIIDSPEKADWALRKIAKAQAVIQENDNLAKAEVERIDAWSSAVNAPFEGDVERFTALLEEYHRKRFTDDPGLKTISLPTGKLKLRRSRTSVDVIDLLSFLEWAKRTHHMHWVRVTEAAAKTEILNSIKASLPDVDQIPPELPAYDSETGESVPGVVLLTGEERFSVEVAT